MNGRRLLRFCCALVQRSFLMGAVCCQVAGLPHVVNGWSPLAAAELDTFQLQGTDYGGTYRRSCRCRYAFSLAYMSIAFTTARDDCSYRTGCTTHPFAQHAVIPSPCSFGSHYGYLSVTMQCFPLPWSSFRHHYYIVLLLLLLLLLLLFKWRLVLWHLWLASRTWLFQHWFA